MSTPDNRGVTVITPDDRHATQIRQDLKKLPTSINAARRDGVTVIITMRTDFQLDQESVGRAGITRAL